MGPAILPVSLPSRARSMPVPAGPEAAIRTRVRQSFRPRCRSRRRSIAVPAGRKRDSHTGSQCPLRRCCWGGVRLRRQPLSRRPSEPPTCTAVRVRRFVWGVVASCVVDRPMVAMGSRSIPQKAPCRPCRAAGCAARRSAHPVSASKLNAHQFHFHLKDRRPHPVPVERSPGKEPPPPWAGPAPVKSGPVPARIVRRPSRRRTPAKPRSPG